MAVRFDAAADRLTHSGAYPQTVAGWTYTAWVRIDVDRNDYSTWLRLNQGGNTVATCGTEADGTTGSNYFTAPGSALIFAPMSSPTTGVWVPVAGTRNPTTGAIKTWIRPSGTGSTVSGSSPITTSDVTATPDQICIGGRGSADATEWFNGSVAHVRIWSAELTQAEIEAEWTSPVPVRSSGLHSTWPLANPAALVNLTGTARTLAPQSGGVLAVTDDPAGAWGDSPYPVFSDWQRELSANALTSAAFTPAAGDVIVVKAGTWGSTVTPGTPSGGSLTYNLAVSETGGGFNGSAYVWTATATGAEGSMSVAMTAPSASSNHALAVEVWRGGHVDTTPATGHTFTNAGAQLAGSITTTADDSIVSWLAYDNNSTEQATPGTHVYSPDAVETGTFPGTGNNGSFYSAAQPAATAGAQTFGLSSPTGRWSAVAVEILAGPASGGGTVTGDVAQAVETDTATAVARRKVRAIGQAVETSSATVVARVKARLIGQAGESSSATAVHGYHVVAVGQAVEQSSAAALRPAKLVPVGQAVELANARPFGRAKTRTVAAAVELSTAAAVTARHITRRILGQAVEDALAGAWARVKLRTVRQAVEVDVAGGIRNSAEAIPPTRLTAGHAPTSTLVAADGGRSRLVVRHD